MDTHEQHHDHDEHGHSHDAADRVDAALEASAEGIRAVTWSLVGLAVTAVAQGAIVVLSGSVALLGDTLHNLADALTALPLWVAFRLGRRARSERYTYGYGRAEDLAGLAIVLAIVASTAVAGYESLRRLLDPQPVDYLGAVVAAGLIGFAGNEAVAQYRIRVGRRIGSAALEADGLHARTDGFTSLAVVAGATGVWLGWERADAVIGLVITVAILVVLRGATRDVYRRLMDAVDPALVARVRQVVAGVPGVETVDDVRIRWIGHRLRAEVSIAVDPAITVVEGHTVADDALHELLHEVPKLSAANVHVSPAGTVGDEHHARLDHHERD